MAKNHSLPRVAGTIERNGRYHLHLAVPVNLHDVYGVTQLRRSLKTADPRQAEREVMRQRVEFDGKAREKERLSDLPKLAEGLRPDQRKLYDEAGGLDGLLAAFEASQTALAFADIAKTDPAHTVAGPDYEPPEPDDPLETAIEEAETRAGFEVLRQATVAEAKTLKALGQQVKAPGEVFGLGELADVYAEKKAQPAKTRANFATVIRRFIEFHGDIALDDLMLAHLRDYGDAVLRLPRYTSAAKLRGLTMPELIRTADSENLERVGPVTRDKDLSILKALTAFGKGQGYMPGDPWRGYSAVTAKGKYAHKKKPRLPFNTEQVKTILSHVAATRDARTLDRWAPLLAAYQGARLEEICQMAGGDVYQVGETWVIRLTDEADFQKVKNASSFRAIPLHRAVIDAGFLGYAKGRAGHVTLFQEFAGRSQKLVDVRPDTDGRMGGHYGKRFSRMLRKELAIEDRARTFHSFRHTWEDAAGDVEMYQAHRKMLAGRSGEEGSQDGYGDGPTQSRLAVSLNKIDPLAARE